MDSPFIFSKAASRACLPDKSILGLSTKPAPRVGDKCFALGWGSTEEVGLSSDDLREVVIPINETCQFSANNVTVQVCGGYQEGGKDSCQGRWFYFGILKRITGGETYVQSLECAGHAVTISHTVGHRINQFTCSQRMLVLSMKHCFRSRASASLFSLGAPLPLPFITNH